MGREGGGEREEMMEGKSVKSAAGSRARTVGLPSIVVLSSSRSCCSSLKTSSYFATASMATSSAHGRGQGEG